MNEKVMKNRFIIIMIIFLLAFSIIIFKLASMQLFNIDKSRANLKKISTTIIYENEKPRGRILDRNNNVLVDNVGINNIVYRKDKKSTIKDEIKLAYTLSDKLDINISRLSTLMLKNFWIVNNKEKATNKITKKEYKMYEERKISKKKLDELVLDRITEKELSKYDDNDKKAAYIYYLMNNGYSYDYKTIKEEVTDEEYAFVEENKDILKGIYTITTWKRIYPYKDTLRSILGSVSTSKQGLPLENKSEYLNKGYALNDRVGLSYLEKMYEDVLHGTKDKYELSNTGKKLISKGHPGNDIVLSIDINLQQELDKIIEEEVLNAKREANTEIYDHSSVVITDPNSGNILALSSKQAIYNNGEYKIKDYTESLLSLSNPPGSVVKGASMLVGYKTGKLNIGDVFYDKCIKFKNTPKKCSWTSGLGALDDKSALTYSSNSYQFQLALKIAGVDYYYNMPVKVDSSALDTYKSVFKSLGLGVKSGIDLPNENEGFKGKESNAGLLLNYAIGQYDSYTPFQLASYINTIINDGNRLKLSLLKEIRKYNSDVVIKEYKKKTLNKVDIDKKYFDRVKDGFRSVMTGPLGRGYMGNIDGAGKTGTSETFYDSDNDNIVDTETYTKSFIGYAPYDNPKMSIVAISPHVRVKKGNSSFASNVNKRIVSRICNYFFEIYK